MTTLPAGRSTTGSRSPSSSVPAAAPLVPLFFAGVAALAVYAGLNDSFPKVFGLLTIIGLLVYAVQRAPEWIVAILLVGQFILHWISSLGGAGISRDNPLGGPLLPMYALCGSLVLTRVMLMRRKRVAPPWPLAAQVIMLCAVLLGVLIAGGLLYTPTPGAARIKLLGYCAFNLAPAALVVMLIDTEERLAKLVRAIIIIGTLMALFTHMGGAAEAGGSAGLYNIGEGKHGLTVAGARFAGGTWFARRLDLVLVSLLVLVALSRRLVTTVPLLALLPYLLVLLFLSGSRGAMAAGVIAMMVVLALLTTIAKSGRVLRITVLALLLVAIGIGVGSVREVILTREIVDRYTVLQRPFETAAAGADRLQYWHSAWNTFVEHPLFGIGTGGWAMVWDQRDYRDYPHNIFLEILCEQGLIGALVFSLFLLGTVWLIWKVLQHPGSTQRVRVLAIWAIGVLTFAVLEAQLSGDIQTNDYIWVAAAVTCVLARITFKAGEGSVGRGES